MKRLAVLNNSLSLRELEGISRVTVSGYKSIYPKQSIEIRPLTILAGANSSGKSSIMQPLLLLKQTLEANYDPGALLLNGPNIKFTLADQLLSVIGKGKRADSFLVGVEVIWADEEPNPDGDLSEVWKKATCEIRFGKEPQGGFEVRRLSYSDDDLEEGITLRPGLTEEEIFPLLPESSLKYEIENEIKSHEGRPKSPRLAVVRERCYLRVEIDPRYWDFFGPPTIPPASKILSPKIQEIIHLPGLRGNPERTYPVTAVSKSFPGTFENYTASIIAQWQVEKDEDKIAKLSLDLESLGLTWKVAAKRINDTQVELQVGRLPKAKNGTRDLVNIVDVGFGVSQTLPVLVALLAAKPGQLVYLEQPEIHLHPRAQLAMAEVLTDAAKRGVRVVVETHSDLLLLGIQTLIAEGRLSPELMKLHWFTRGSDGVTKVASADLDSSGAFKDWPEDFGDVALHAQSRYLDAAEAVALRH